MGIPEEFWPTPEEAHPKAKRLLKEEFFWSSGDDNSPHGNDNGADTFLEFHEWLLENPDTDSSEYILEALGTWHVRGVEWDCLDPARLAVATITHDSAHALLIWDDMAISLAFAQLILEGKVHPELREKVLVAIKRQALPTIIDFRNWVIPDERIKRLEIMKRVLLWL